MAAIARLGITVPSIILLNRPDAALPRRFNKFNGSFMNLNDGNFKR